MPLEIRKRTDGTLRPIWYGRYEVNGKRFCHSLGVKIAGTPPPSFSLREEGDGAFERSRANAQAKLERIIEDAHSTRDTARIAEKIYEANTGKKIEFPKLEDLEQRWLEIPRRRTPSDNYTKRCTEILMRFVSFVQDRQPVETFAKVSNETARDFMNYEQERGLAPKTWNDELKLLRATFKKLHPNLTDGYNPFNGLVTKTPEQVRRAPYTVEELQFILEASKMDPFIQPIITTGICTAMRRGDCCLLSWDAVDLNDGYVMVKTSKTGETVEIPMFPMLQGLLLDAYTKAKRALPERKKGHGPQPEPEGYVFPEPAAMYKKSPDGITWRVKKVITEAFRMKAVAAGDIFAEAAPEELQRKAYAYIDSLGNAAKAPRMRNSFDLYMSGLNVNEVAAKNGQKKPTISGHLNEIEDAIELAFIRGKVRLEKKDALQKERAEGKGSRRASVRDFHSFRVTWITLALAAGVPLELVQRVTGHKTTEVVLKHYFRPGREDFKKQIMNAMPRLLVDPADKAIDVEVVEADDKESVAALDEIAETLKGVTGKANQARVENALKRLESLAQSISTRA